MKKIKAIFNLIKQTFAEWSNDHATRLAAALAYYTVFSLAPLVLIAIVIAGAFFGEEAARGEIVGQIQGLVGANGANMIESTIDNVSNTGNNFWASTISILVLLFGASGVFVALQDALNTIWDVKAKPQKGVINFIRKRFLSFSAVLGVGFLLLVSLIISAALSALDKYMSSVLPGFDAFWFILNLIVSLGIITLLFALMFKYLPDVKIEWRDVWLGAFITAILFTIGKFAIGFYLGRGTFSSTYGAAGSLVAILAWVYYSAQILFFGAEFTQVYTRESGRDILPNEYAISLQDNSKGN
ncbi:YihY/virulence factor BrkB family protein [Aureispira sp. CCB-QB1]|uniref:YihY/virulence factor BrkB family protein n=1 Tax=Aureispira sp. CCB-QB1 TaxID=1313421 RepID=UPI00069918D7|nr:YihY/virulence factor BrkB family protein [Aureispira sp. CCB-QB1]